MDVQRLPERLHPGPGRQQGCRQAFRGVPVRAAGLHRTASRGAGPRAPGAQDDLRGSRLSGQRDHRAVHRGSRSDGRCSGSRAQSGLRDAAARIQREGRRDHRLECDRRDGPARRAERRGPQGRRRCHRAAPRRDHELLIVPCSSRSGPAKAGPGARQPTARQARGADPLAVATTTSDTLDRRYALLGTALIAPTVLIFCAVILYPLISAIYLSLFSIFTPTLEGNWVGVDNYAVLLASGRFWNALANTLIWTIGTLILQIVCGVGVALLLNQSIVFRSLARSLVLFPYFLSTVVAVLVWRWLFNDLYGILNHLMLAAGLIDMPVNWLGAMPNAMISIIVVGAWKYFPFVVIAVLARLQTIPDPLYEAARIDGAGPIARFFDVTLPQLREVLIVIILLRAIWDFKEFDLIWLMTGGGPINSTQTLPLVVYQEAFGLNQMGMAAAYAVTMMIVMLAFMLIYLRQTRDRDPV
ncbi:ABC transporter permease subunit [Roseitalea porphyridii]|uniref:ABC transporter permease subunit n=1 Tax=Roseitalea porphyridii TaxID=1852022 RepID=A0A4P6V0M0_9HYPH|nr:ABC transporter permease subunit [Roseitalea porphyridii]